MDFLGGIGSLLSGLFGGKKENQSFERHSTTESSASAQDLSPDLLKALETLFTSTIGNGQFQQSGNAISGRLDQLTNQSKLPDFDVAAFAKGITDQATAGANLKLDSDINSILSKSGTTESGNSMNALLANKLRNETAANLAGITQQATASGEAIRQSQQSQITQGIQGLAGSLSDQILKLIQSTRGASTTGTSKSKEDTKGTGTTQESQNPLGLLGSLFSSMGNARTAA